MKKSLLTMLLLAATFGGISLDAQIGMHISVNRTSYMQYEPVFARITLRNDTGKALLFGKSPQLQGFLMLEIRSGTRLAPKRKGKEISIDGLILGPGESTGAPPYSSGWSTAAWSGNRPWACPISTARSGLRARSAPTRSAP